MKWQSFSGTGGAVPGIGEVAMYGRLLAELLLWGMRGGLAWLVMHEYADIVVAKLTLVSRALAGM